MRGGSTRLAAAGALTILGEIDAHLPVALGIFAPAFAKPDETEEAPPSARAPRQLLAGKRADLLDGPALGAEHDLALALARHVDRLLDPDTAVLQFLPVRSLHRELIGKFLM